MAEGDGNVQKKPSTAPQGRSSGPGDSAALDGPAQDSKPINRGNGVDGSQVQTDASYNKVLGQQKAIEDSLISKQDSLASEHGDVGRAGSYRISWEVES